MNMHAKPKKTDPMSRIKDLVWALHGGQRTCQIWLGTTHRPVAALPSASSSSKSEMDELRALCPTVRDGYFEGREDLFGGTLHDGRPAIHPLFVKGDKETGIRLGNKLRQSSLPGDDFFILSELLGKENMPYIYAQMVLDGAQPLGYLYFMRVIEGLRKDGMNVTPHEVLGLPKPHAAPKEQVAPAPPPAPAPTAAPAAPQAPPETKTKVPPPPAASALPVVPTVAAPPTAKIVPAKLLQEAEQLASRLATDNAELRRQLETARQATEAVKAELEAAEALATKAKAETDKLRGELEEARRATEAATAKAVAAERLAVEHEANVASVRQKLDKAETALAKANTLAREQAKELKASRKAKAKAVEVAPPRREQAPAPAPVVVLPLVGNRHDEAPESPRRWLHAYKGLPGRVQRRLRSV